VRIEGGEGGGGRAWRNEGREWGGTGASGHKIYHDEWVGDKICLKAGGYCGMTI
jgi:hypothetical protein